MAVPWEVYGTVGGAKLPLAMLWAFVIGVAMVVGAVGRLPSDDAEHRARRRRPRLAGVTAGGGSRLRLGIVGTGWIATTHLADLARLGRTELVGVVSRTPEAAAETAGTWGGRPYADVDAMLDEARPDVVCVCVPPHRSVAIGERLVERGIPFLVEKPLAAADADGPARLAAAIDARRAGRRRSATTGAGSTCSRRSASASPSDRHGSSSRAGSAARRRRPGGAGSTRAAARSSSRPRTSWTSRGTSSARRR